jgi:hypothetical protein
LCKKFIVNNDQMLNYWVWPRRQHYAAVIWILTTMYKWQVAYAYSIYQSMVCLHAYKWQVAYLKKGSPMHVAPACAGSREGSACVGCVLFIVWNSCKYIWVLKIYFTKSDCKSNTFWVVVWNSCKYISHLFCYFG